jgi:amino acid transporter
MSISIQGVVNIVITLLVLGIVFGLLDLLIRKAPFIPEEWKAGIRWVLLVLAVLVLIAILLSFVGGTPIFRA